MKVRLKDVVSLISNKSSDIGSKPYLPLEMVESWTGKVLGYQGNSDFTGDVNLFSKNDVLFNKLRPYLAKVVHADAEGGVSTEALVLRSDYKLLDSEYLFFKLLSPDFIHKVDHSTYGTKMPRASSQFILNSELSLPNKKAQIEIVNTLKIKARAIDIQIEKLAKKLSILDEYKTALIHNAVTKGLDANNCRILDGTPAGEMKWKDSGVEWIGEVPEGWDVKSIKTIVSLFGEGGTPSTGNDEYWENGNIPWVTVSDICEEIINTKKMITQEGLNGSSANLWPVGTVILSNAATIGSVGIAKVPLCTKQGISGFVVNSDVNNYFFSQCLVDKKDRFNRMARETTFKSLNGAFLKNESVAMPLMDEQEAISSFIKSKSNLTESLKQSIRKKIELLLEYKKSLINEAVSGEL